MTYSYYITLIGEYINLGRSEEQLLGQIGFPAEIDVEPEKFVKAIKIIGAAADANIEMLVELSELSQTAFGRKYGFPLRTVQSWCADNRKPPEYVVRLIGYAMLGELQL